MQAVPGRARATRAMPARADHENVVQYDSHQINEGWLSLGVVRGSAGAGPFPEGVKSVFRWPAQLNASAVPGRLFRVIVRRVYHQKKWAIYRAFPRWRQPTHLVDGVHVVSGRAAPSGMALEA